MQVCVCVRKRERELLLLTVYFIQLHVFITNQNIFLGNAYFYYLNLTILHDFSNNTVFKIQFRKYECKKIKSNNVLNNLRYVQKDPLKIDPPVLINV